MPVSAIFSYLTILPQAGKSRLLLTPSSRSVRTHEAHSQGYWPVFWWRIWWQIRGFEGTSADQRRSDCSNLLIWLGSPSGSNPSLPPLSFLVSPLLALGLECPGGTVVVNPEACRGSVAVCAICARHSAEPHSVPMEILVRDYLESSDIQRAVDDVFPPTRSASARH
jgi:hypothetical protein